MSKIKVEDMKEQRFLNPLPENPLKELLKDKERLDWLMENDCLRDWIANGVAYGLNEGREYIDAAMEEYNVNN